MISVAEKIALLVIFEQETESGQRGEKVKRKNILHHCNQCTTKSINFSNVLYCVTATNMGAPMPFLKTWIRENPFFGLPN